MVVLKQKVKSIFYEVYKLRRKIRSSDEGDNSNITCGTFNNSRPVYIVINSNIKILM